MDSNHEQQVGIQHGHRPGVTCSRCASQSSDGFSVYVGGPIDFAADNARAGWTARRDRTVRDLRAAGGVRVFAAHEDTVAHKQTEQHAEAMEDALVNADAMIAYLPPGVVTYGTPIEIYRARDFGIPVLVVGCRESVEVGHHGGSVAINRLGVDYLDGVNWADESEWVGWCRHRRDNRRAVGGSVVAGPSVITGPIATPVQATSALPFAMDEGKQWALPMRHYPDDAGLDLFVTEDRTIRPGEFVDVPAGCRMALPDGVWGLVIGRSSTTRQRGVLVTPAVIDSGWRGPMLVGAYNAGRNPQTINVGDRIGQIVLMPNLTAQFSPAGVAPELLPPGSRGNSGFGSTGGIAHPDLPPLPDSERLPE